MSCAAFDRQLRPGGPPGKHRRIAYAVVLALGVAGYLDAPRWLILACAAGLTLNDWRLWRLRGPSRVAWTPKTVTYFVTGALIDLALAGLAFVGGRMLALLLG